MIFDRTELAEFLRSRRHALRPEDVGLPAGSRRRTPGLRREEVAHLCYMSTDYYTRLERQRGPRPSEQMVGSIARGLRLSANERDHLYHLVGHHPPARRMGDNRINPNLLRVFDQLAGSPAEIVTELHETLRQSPLGVAVTGATTDFTGPARSHYYRWFMQPATRRSRVAADHTMLSRAYTAELRQVAALRGPGSPAAALIDLLLEGSAEFRSLWRDHKIDDHHRIAERIVHPEMGLLELSCSRLTDPGSSHSLVVYTAAPGSDMDEKLRILQSRASISSERTAFPTPPPPLHYHSEQRFPAASADYPPGSDCRGRRCLPPPPALAQAAGSRPPGHPRVVGEPAARKAGGTGPTGM